MDIALIDTMTPSLVASGQRLFQIHRFAPTDHQHCIRLLRWAEPSYRAHVVDMGCGIGEMLWYWEQERKDIIVTGVNVSKVQLKFGRIPAIHCDMANTPFDDLSCELVTFCFSIGHTDWKSSLDEAHRILAHGGAIFIYDMCAEDGTTKDLPGMQYTVFPREQILQLIEEAHFTIDWVMEPKETELIPYGEKLFGPLAAYVFSRTRPIIVRAVKA